MEKTVRILKAEVRPYKDKKTGEDKSFSQVSVLLENQLEEMACSKELAEYVLKHFTDLSSKEIQVEVKPRGFELIKLLV